MIGYLQPGHILGMGEECKLKRAIFVMFKAPQPGDTLMDAPQTDSWRELCTMDVTGSTARRESEH